MHTEALKHIIEGCKREDAKQQELLFNAYSPILYGLCCRYIGDRDDAEDVLQEAFIKIFLNIRQYKESGSFEGWMKKIAVHTALHFLKQKKRLKFESIDVTDIPNGEDEGSDSLFEDEPDEQFIFDCMAQLPLGYKTVLNLFLVENFSHKEIAEQLNIKESTSRSQFSKGRKLLLDLIKKRQSTIHEQR